MRKSWQSLCPVLGPVLLARVSRLVTNCQAYTLWLTILQHATSAAAVRTQLPIVSSAVRQSENAIPAAPATAPLSIAAIGVSSRALRAPTEKKRQCTWYAQRVLHLLREISANPPFHKPHAQKGMAWEDIADSLCATGLFAEFEGIDSSGLWISLLLAYCCDSRMDDIRLPQQVQCNNEGSPS